MYELGRSQRRSVNIWPGFVDGLASLLLVVIFVLMVFMVAQFFLRASLTGKDEALDRLNREVSELAELLALERAANADLRINQAQLSSELQSSLAQRETLSNQLNLLIEERERFETLLAEAEASSAQSEEELRAAYEIIEADKAKIETQLAELAILKTLRDEMTRQLAEMEAALTRQEEAADALRRQAEDAQAESESLRARIARAQSEREEQVKLTDEAQSKVDLLNRQISALRQQLARLAVTLEAAEAQNAEREVQIADLGRRLNVALASKVQELSRYRSEFFGRLRAVIGSRSDIRIVGDRFVFQSELLFETGFAELGEPGKVQLRQLASTLIAITSEIPQDIDWILRIDGHTDKRPIVTSDFPSNWELSTARAISVVKFLIEQGIPRERLAATGFGEFQPLDPGEDEIAYRRNRRIEFKFTQK